MSILSPGDLFHLPRSQSWLTCRWLFVREHVDNPNSLLLVPVTEFQMIGLADVITPQLPLTSSRLAARCYTSCFINRIHAQVGAKLITKGEPEAWQKVVEDCERVLAHLAREIPINGLLSDSVSSEERQTTENVYDYQHHIDLARLSAEAIVEWYGQ